MLDLEILIHLGAKYIIAVGETGAIKEGLEIGNIVLPTWGLREEGTSYHYAPIMLLQNIRQNRVGGCFP